MALHGKRRAYESVHWITDVHYLKSTDISKCDALKVKACFDCVSTKGHLDQWYRPISEAGLTPCGQLHRYPSVEIYLPFFEFFGDVLSLKENIGSAFLLPNLSVHAVATPNVILSIDFEELSDWCDMTLNTVESNGVNYAIWVISNRFDKGTLDSFRKLSAALCGYSSKMPLIEVFPITEIPKRDRGFLIDYIHNRGRAQFFAGYGLIGLCRLMSEYSVNRLQKVGLGREWFNQRSQSDEIWRGRSLLLGGKKGVTPPNLDLHGLLDALDLALGRSKEARHEIWQHWNLAKIHDF